MLASFLVLPAGLVVRVVQVARVQPSPSLQVGAGQEQLAVDLCMGCGSFLLVSLLLTHVVLYVHNSC
jgi:hypothetical protein